MGRISDELLLANSRISINPDIMGGAPCVRGTRVPLYVIMDNLEGGSGFDEIIENYPTLTRDDIRAAIRFCSHSVVKIFSAELL